LLCPIVSSELRCCDDGFFFFSFLTTYLGTPTVPLIAQNIIYELQKPTITYSKGQRNAKGRQASPPFTALAL
jgi:hypothetical protein